MTIILAATIFFFYSLTGFVIAVFSMADFHVKNYRVSKLSEDEFVGAIFLYPAMTFFWPFFLSMFIIIALLDKDFRKTVADNNDCFRRICIHWFGQIVW